MRNISDKFVEEITKPILYSITFFFPRESCRLWDNVERYGGSLQATDNNVIRRMRCAWWIPKATSINLEHVILSAILRQQWLHESASLLRHTYISCIVTLR